MRPSIRHGYYEGVSKIIGGQTGQRDEVGTKVK